MSFNCIITTLGQAKFAAALAAGSEVSVTHIAVGDGNGNATTPSAGQAALVREVYRNNISSITVNPANSSQVIFEGVVEASVGGWTARELGLFDSAGDLIAVANIGSVYKPTVAEGSAREMVLRVIAEVGQTDAVNLVVDPSFYIATRSWVQSNFSVAALLPGGTTGQILRKLSNANGDTEWADPLSAQNVTVDVVQEIQTLSSGQTVVNLATATTSGMAVYIEGIRLRPNQYTVNTATQFTLAQSYPANSKLLAVQNDPNAALDFARKTLNLADLTDKPSARGNLGLGSAAVKNEADFIPASQASTYVPKAGGTMTGPLVLPGNPSAALQAATKQYVDGTLNGANNGYVQLPGGFIMQWGRISVGVDASATVTFSIAFPNSCIGGFANSPGTPSGGGVNIVAGTGNFTTTTMAVRNDAGQTQTINWLAIGY